MLRSQKKWFLIILGFVSQVQVLSLKFFFDREKSVRIDPVDFFVAAVSPINFALKDGLLEQCREVLGYRYKGGLGSYNVNLLIKFNGSLYQLSRELLRDLELMENTICQSVVKKNYPVKHRLYDQVCFDMLDLIETVYKQTKVVLSEVVDCKQPSISEIRDESSPTVRYQVNKIITSCKALEGFLLWFNSIFEQQSDFFALAHKLHREAMALAPYDSESFIEPQRCFDHCGSKIEFCPRDGFWVRWYHKNFCQKFNLTWPHRFYKAIKGKTEQVFVVIFRFLKYLQINS